MTEIRACDDPAHCITCSDEGIPMRVVSCDADGALAWCESETGARSEVLIGLIEHACAGDVVLVHAGTALTRVGT
ncbi:MAG TPA: HypC/HybG/HupF family hydrogenase formation chaperone [Gemmatimonadaceae bacterium]